MYLGVPCILGQPTYTKECFTHRKYAYLVPNDDPGVLAETILLLKKDKRLRKTLSINCPLFLKKLSFDKGEIISKTIELYKKGQKTWSRN